METLELPGVETENRELTRWISQQRLRANASVRERSLQDFTGNNGRGMVADVQSTTAILTKDTAQPVKLYTVKLGLGVMIYLIQPNLGCALVPQMPFTCQSPLSVGKI
jgi:hypothetical protein